MPYVIIDQERTKEPVARLAALEKNAEILRANTGSWEKEFGSGAWVAVWGGKVVFHSAEEQDLVAWAKLQPEERILSTLIARLGDKIVDGFSEAARS